MEEKRSAALMDHFGELEDPRIDRHREHKLIDLLVIAICAILCGANAWVAVETFGKAKREWFQRFLELPHGIPSHDTFGRVFALLAPEQLQAGFLSWIQLIDALQDQHLWSERYHRPLTDIFALQDEIVQKIVTTLGLQFTLVEQGTCLKVRQATNNVEAYETLLRGASYYMHFAQETNLQARQLAEKAIALDPQYAEAYALQAWTYWVEWDLQWSQDSQIVEQAFVLAQRARILDDSVPSAHMLLGYIYLWKNQPEQAVAAGERAITVSPSDDASYAVLGRILLNIGRPEEAIGMVEKALRLNPHSVYEIFLGEAYYLTGRSEEAIIAQNRVLAHNSNLWPAHLQLAALYNRHYRV